MRVIERIEQLQVESVDIAESYCKNCQELLCDNCPIVWRGEEVRITADGTLVISLDAGDDLDQIWRVMVERGVWCRMFYEEGAEDE